MKPTNLTICIIVDEEYPHGKYCISADFGEGYNEWNDYVSQLHKYWNPNTKTWSEFATYCWKRDLLSLIQQYQCFSIDEDNAFKFTIHRFI